MLHVAGVAVRYGDVAALAGVDLDAADGEVVAVVGPSGSGKSTLLRVVAGLERPDAGRVEWDGEDLTDVPPHRRGFGLMFQDYALFPHRDVAGNVAFGLRMQGLDTAAAAARVAEVLALVGLPGLGHRSVGTLSGGEAQRVALARALAPGPRLLMLDEPLGSLDRALRERLLLELGELFAGLGITVLYVTHDQEEAFAVADRVAIMRAGCVERAGSPEELWHDPGTEFVARFLGFTNIVDAEVAAGAARTPWGTLPVDLADGRHRIVVRPDGFALADDGAIGGRVAAAAFRGDHVATRIEPDTGPEITAALRARVAPGTAVRLDVDPAAVAMVTPD